jgi:hypothetical protein
MLSPPLVRYVLTAAVRDRLMLTLVLMVACGTGLAIFLGSTAIIEGGQFSVVFAAGGLRFLGVASVVLFTSFHIRRAFEHKEVEFLLSRPISRPVFLLSHAAAFMLLAAAAALLVALPLTLGGTNTGGLAAWTLSLVVEYAVMAVTAMFFAMAIPSAAGAALATLGFYTLARLIGTLLGIMTHPPENALFGVLAQVMQVISVVVPRLDLMGQTSWLIYGVAGSGGIALQNGAGAASRFMATRVGLPCFLVLQGAVFISLLLAAANFDFRRRRF